MSARERFRAIAHATASAVGSPFAFAAALLVIIGWAVCGPIFDFSDTWQLIINTGTTIITFLMVFMIQNTQNRDSRAIHLKLDELIRAISSARNRLVDIEDMSDEELARLAREFQRLRDKPSPPDREGAQARAVTQHRATPPAGRTGSLRSVAHRTRNRSK